MAEMTTNTTPNTPRVRRKRKSSRGFWIGLGVFAAILILFWAFVIGYVRRCMVTYEAAQPENLVQQVVQDLQQGKAGDFTYSRFEDPDRCREVYGQLLQGKELSIRKSPASYDALAPVYEVTAEGQKVATVSLREKDSTSLMFILTLQEWEVTGINPVLNGQEPYVFTVPDGYTVQVNGIPLDQRELTGNRRAIDDFKYAANYVTVPDLVEYRVEGLIAPPDIQVLDPQGQAVTDVEQEGNEVQVKHFTSTEMPEDLASYVLKNAKDYSNFFSSDLPGSVGSINPIRPMFPSDSYYLELAENYRQHDMWMYSGHNTPTFSGEKVSNYVRYSEDFFSCEIYFDKRMILTRTGDERHDITHTRYYYVNLDGKWLIADMQQIIEED